MEEKAFGGDGRFSSKKFDLIKTGCPAMGAFLADFYEGLSASEAYCLAKQGLKSSLRCASDGCTEVVHRVRSKRRQYENFGFLRYCSVKCAATCVARNTKIVATWEDRFGGCGFGSEASKAKACATMNQRYGSEYYVTAEGFEAKRIESCLRSFGCAYPMQNEDVKQKHRSRFIENHGYEGALCAGSPFKEAALATTCERYGSRQIMATAYMRELREGDGSWVPLDQKAPFAIYRTIVRKLTARTIRQFGIKGLNRVGRGTFHIDHKVSIKAGFEASIPPYILASLHNLEVISCSANCSKRANISISIHELFDRIFGPGDDMEKI